MARFNTYRFDGCSQSFGVKSTDKITAKLPNTPKNKRMKSAAAHNTISVVVLVTVIVIIVFKSVRFDVQLSSGVVLFPSFSIQSIFQHEKLK